jgi:hypothetical protein
MLKAYPLTKTKLLDDKPQCLGMLFAAKPKLSGQSIEERPMLLAHAQSTCDRTRAYLPLAAWAQMLFSISFSRSILLDLNFCIFHAPCVLNGCSRCNNIIAKRCKLRWRKRSVTISH